MKLLFVEPQKGLKPTFGQPDSEMVEMFIALIPLMRFNKETYRGFHTAPCGVHSGNTDIYLPDGTVTNSLALYYLRYYPSEITVEDLDKIQELYEKYIINGQEPVQLKNVSAVAPTLETFEAYKNQDAYLEMVQPKGLDFQTDDAPRLFGFYFED